MPAIEDLICFIKDFFHIYLEKRDFNKIWDYMSPSISWIGTGKHEVCHDFDDAQSLMDAEKKAWDGRFKILNSWYESIKINSSTYIVFGEMTIQEDGLNIILLDMFSRFSMICEKSVDGFKIIHAHFSVPNAGQNEDEFVHKHLVKDYNLKLEQKLEERTQLLREKTDAMAALMSSLQGGIIVYRRNTEYTITYLNEGFCALLGYTEKEIHDLFADSYAHLPIIDGFQKIETSLLMQLSEKEFFSLEYPMRRKDGSEMWVLEKGSRIMAEKGEELIQSTLTDITKQKRLEQELRQTNLELEVIYGHVSFGVIMRRLTEQTDHAEVAFINNRALEIVGYTREQYRLELGGLITSFITSDDIAQFTENVRVLLETGGPVYFKIRANHRNGNVIWLSGCSVCITDWRGMKMGIYTFQDISEEEAIRAQLVKQNAELLISERRYEIAVQQSGAMLYDYILETDEMIFPIILSQELGLPSRLEHACTSVLWETIVHPKSLKTFYDVHAKVREGIPSVRETIIVFNQKGNEIWYDITLTTIFDDKKKAVRAVALLQNITEKCNLEKEKQYRQVMTSNKQMIFEANVTCNSITEIDSLWALEFNIPSYTLYTDLVNYIVRDLAPQNQQSELVAFFSLYDIESCMEHDQKKRSLQYQCKSSDGLSCWMQYDMMGICDEVTGDVRIRCYAEDISRQKEKEERVFEEQRLYDLMIARAATVYEVNLTKDICIRGHEDWPERLGIETSQSYSMLIESFAKKTIHHEDMYGFLYIFNKTHMLSVYEQGTRELCYEYRRKEADGGFLWVSCTIHIFEHLENGELHAFCYVQDIHEEKLKQLELIYRAEHDQLTGVYNKQKSEYEINTFLSSDDGKNGKHAFFIFDLDHFKEINDILGHAFGDVVLSRTASRVKELFRDDDIVARIGGDEFIILMKNVYSERGVYSKAVELCETVREVYTHNEKELLVSLSVGIAIYPNHGLDYDALYKKSDIALYSAKEQGRDCFVLYQDTLKATHNPERIIDVNDLLESRSFERNVSEYVFRILYETTDKSTAIQSVLELVGKQYNISRSYVFENSEDDLFACNTFEWCKEGIEAQKHNLQHLTYTTLDNYYENFNADGIFYLKDMSCVSQVLRDVLEPQGIKSMFQFAIAKNKHVSGFVGFDFCETVRNPTKSEITILKTVANMLGVFLNEMRAFEATEKMRNVALSIVDALDSFAYIIDRNTFKLLFVNRQTTTLVPTISVGDLCYKGFWGLDTPCERCPMMGLTDMCGSKCTMDMHNVFLHKVTRATATWIDWTDGKRVCLMDCIDITEFAHEGDL